MCRFDCLSVLHLTCQLCLSEIVRQTTTCKLVKCKIYYLKCKWQSNCNIINTFYFNINNNLASIKVVLWFPVLVRNISVYSERWILTLREFQLFHLLQKLNCFFKFFLCLMETVLSHNGLFIREHSLCLQINLCHWP